MLLASQGSPPTNALFLAHTRPSPELSLVNVLQRTNASTRALKVMAVGGSVAVGWNDATKEGYLGRAMQQVGATLRIHVDFLNKSTGGFTPTRLGTTYARYLQQIQPQVVIISWGLLDDIADKISEAQFMSEIEYEVALAAKQNCEVWIVTPPVTTATYVGKDAAREPTYAADEITAARDVKGAKVVVFDLLDEMKRYLKNHHLSYQPLESNAWHPNTQGHQLAGELLAESIIGRGILP